MRIAILSDIHGNRTAFEAVLADLRQTSPDLILHGGDLAAADREALGEERLAWLSSLPRVQIHGPIALVHASPGDPWRAPASGRQYRQRQPFVRRRSPRGISIARWADSIDPPRQYDVDRELKALAASGLPHSDWMAKMLASARPQMP